MSKGADIVDLRRQIKMLQSENAILRKKLGKQLDKKNMN